MNFKKDISYWTVWLSIAVITYFHFTNPRLKNGYFTNEISWDITTYYLYLPFTFIYHDIGIRNHEVIDKIWDKYKPSSTQYQIYKLENGNWTINYTAGFAILHAPFFFIGHLWALNSHYPADGFSFPYQFCVANGVMLYIFLGLFMIRKVLLRLISPVITALTLILLLFGTNYFSEAYNGYLQPHAILFTGYAILLFYTIKWHETPHKKYIIIAGFVMGLMVLARPSEIVCIFIPMFWNVYNKESFKQKLLLIRQYRSHFGLLLLAAFIPFIPQIIYWKVVTGQWLFFSYQHTEGFDFDSPHIINALFSFKSSLLIYSPIIIFPIIGIFLLKKYNKNIFLPVTVYLLANFYLLSSWPGWWNTRYFVESYAVMSIPFGFLLTDLSRRNLVVKITSSLIISFFFVLTLFQTWQFAKGIIPFQRMNFEYYKRIFFKTKVNSEDIKYQGVERSLGETEVFSSEKDYNKFTLAYFNFESINSVVIEPERLDSIHYLSPPYSYRLGQDDQYGLTYKIRYDQLVKPKNDHVWIRIKLNYLSEADIKDNPTCVVVEMPHKKYSLKYSGFGFDHYPSKTGEWNTVSFDYMTPYPYSEKDYIKIYVFHIGHKNLYIDNMQIDAYEPKPL